VRAIPASPSRPAQLTAPVCVVFETATVAAASELAAVVGVTVVGTGLSSDFPIA
jgi:hypothetical protein